MNTGFGTNLEGFIIEGNVSITKAPIQAVDGDGSLEASGTIYIDTIREYSQTGGVTIQDTVFQNYQITIPYTQPSLGLTTASLLIDGGIYIRNTTNSTSLTSGGGLTVLGGSSFNKDVNIGGFTNLNGITRVFNTTESTVINNGSLIIDGGVGIAKNVNIGGNTTITGNLYVAGTTTQVNTQTILIQDNTLVINSGPGGSRDCGILFHRDGADVTTETSITNGTLIDIDQTSFTLGGSFITDYNGWWLKTSDGSAQISTYNGTTGTLYTSGSTLIGSPTELSFNLYNRSYLGQYYDESSDELRFAYIADATDPKVNLDNLDNYADTRLKTLYANFAVSTANLTVTNSATIASITLSSGILDSATIGTLYVTNGSILHGGITTGSIQASGGANISQISTGGLNVSGNSILNGGLTTGSIYASGGGIINIGLTSGSLNISGSSVLHGTTTIGGLVVTGASYFADDLLITGGNLTVTSGSIVFNTVDVSPSMADISNERSATIGNNIVSATNILSFTFDNAVARVFDAVVSVTINGTTGNKYAYYNLKGVQKDPGNWILNSSFIGDITGITFSITSGQLQYTTVNKLDFTNGVVKFRALTTTV